MYSRFNGNVYEIFDPLLISSINNIFYTTRIHWPISQAYFYKLLTNRLYWRQTRFNWFKNSELGIRETMWWAAYKWESSIIHDFRTLCWVWYSGLWSFQPRGTKLERFLHKNQHTKKKFLNFENWTTLWLGLIYYAC